MVKLSKLSSVNRVYRGIRGGNLPEAFTVANEYGVKGGVEPGFTSCTLDPEVAEQYARGPRGAGHLFVCEQGMVDRGANLDWLSQYPHEREVVFAPLLGVQVLQIDEKPNEARSSKKRSGGVGYSRNLQPKRLIVRLNVNRSALSIEEVVSRMRRSYLQLIDLLLDDLKDAAPPSSTLNQLAAHADRARMQDPLWYNVPENYKNATHSLLETHRAAIQGLAAAELWDVESASAPTAPVPPPAVPAFTVNTALDYRDSIPARMRKCAALCASSGQPHTAAELLLMAAERERSAQLRTPTKSRILSHSITSGWASQLSGQPRGDGIPDRISSYKAPSWASAQTGDRRNSTAGDRRNSMAGDRRNSTAGDRRNSTEITEAHNRSVLAAYQDEEMSIDEAMEDWPTRPEKGDGDSSSGSAVSTTIEEEEATRRVLKAALPCLREGAPLPWPSVLVALTGYGLAGHARSAAPSPIVAWTLGRLAAPTVEQERFAVRRLVLAYDSTLQLWKRGRITGVRLADDETKHYDVRTFGVNAELKSLAAWQVLTVGSNGGGAGALLREAAAAGAAPLVKSLLDGNVSVHDATPDAQTALHLAARNGHAECCALLLRGGANSAAPDKGMDTPLALAVKNAWLSVRRVFEPSAADLDARDGEAAGFTRLMRAAHAGEEIVVEQLLAETTDGDGGVTALMDASSQRGSTALTVAVDAGHTHVARLLLQLPNAAARVNVTLCDGMTPLMLASSLPNEESDRALSMLRMLIEHGAEVNASSAKKASTPLILAAQNDFTGLVHALLENGADVNHPRKDGWSALHVAADGGFTETCTALLEAGASLSQLTTKRGASPLHTAARRGHTAVLDVLLNFKANPLYARKEDGTTALHLAARNGFDSSVRRLIKSGLLHEKLTHTRREGVEGTNALMFAALLGRDAVARTLLSAGVDPETLDSRMENALHYAAVGGWPTTLMIIIDHSTSPIGVTQQRNQDGKRPIDVADESGHTGIVALLQKIEIDATTDRKVAPRRKSSALVRDSLLTPSLQQAGVIKAMSAVL